VQGNLIGTDGSGRGPLGNAWDGVAIWDGGSNTVTGNVISANVGSGVRVAGFGSNTIAGNSIGGDRGGFGLPVSVFRWSDGDDERYYVVTSTMSWYDADQAAAALADTSSASAEPGSRCSWKIPFLRTIDTAGTVSGRG